MIAEALGRLLMLVQPGSSTADLLVAAALLAALCAVAHLVVGAGASDRAAARAAFREAFAEVRVLLRASDPSIAGHRRARAPGATR